MPHLSIVVPAYNEAERIGATLARMTAYLDAQPYTYELIVVDDGSSDSTRQIVSDAGANHPHLRMLTYTGNRGKGFAVRFGILEATGDFVLFSDADLATPIEEVERLFAAMRQESVVTIGSRDVPGSRLERRQSLLREFAGKFFNRCVQMLAVPGVHDTQCGFKLFTRTAAQEIFPLCRINNFSFDVEALYLARKLGYVIVEVPVRWSHQDGSKVRMMRDATRMIKTLFRIRATHYPITARERLRSSD